MSGPVRKTINRLAKKPERLFLIDSFGAILTAFLLFVVLRNFHEYFGMPQSILTCLAGIALIFCIYSATCYLLLKDNWSPYIKVISTANLLYCVLTIVLIVIYYPVLTILGLGYFIAEIVVICGLVFIELKVAKTLEKKVNQTTR